MSADVTTTSSGVASGERPLICVDARMLSPVPHGFSRYVSRMIAGLRHVNDLAHGDVPYRLGFLVNRDTPRADIESLGPEFARTIEIRSKFLDPLELLEIPGALTRAGAALYHSPSFSSVLGLHCPAIVTIHDLNHLTYGGKAEKLYYRYILRRFARRARAVLTVSEFSRRELAEWVPLPVEAIEVVPNALDAMIAEALPDEVVQEVLSRHGLERGRYFLALSNPKPHKNITMLVEAYRRSGAHWPLVLSMSVPEGAPAGVRGIGGVSDKDATALMQAAGGVCFPSLYEGFGLPPVEGACAGAPVLVSDIPPHREGLQDLVEGECTWLPAQDTDAWAKALSAAERGEKRPASAESRRQILHRYSIDRLGEAMDRIYRGVLGI